MKVKVIGIADVNYTSKKTNQLVEGKTLHCTRKAERPEDIGELTDTVFISKRSNAFGQIDKIKIGSDINVYYNRFGAVDDIAVN